MFRAQAKIMSNGMHAIVLTLLICSNGVMASKNDQEFADVLADIKHDTSPEMTRESWDSLQKIFQSVVESQGRVPAAEALFHPLLSGNQSDMSQSVFVFGLIGSSLAGNSGSALEALSRVSLDSTYSDSLGEKTTPETLLLHSYQWFVNNSTQKVPGRLVALHPEVIAQTPYWGSTRDGYFAIQRPEEPTWFDGEQHAHWFRLLTDIESPNKKAHFGTIRNLNFKAREISAGLLLYAPSWLLENSKSRQTSEKEWLECWSKLGVYENFKTAEYLSARNGALNGLSEFVMKRHSLTRDKARKLASIHIKSVERIFTSPPKRVQNHCAKTLTLLESGRHLELKFEDYLDTELRLTGSFLATRNKTALFDFIASKETPENQNVFDEIRSYSIVVASIFDERLLRKANYHSWGDMNKSPLAYALQFNNHGAVDFLMTKSPDLMSINTIESPFWDGPSIYNRTPLMYALEYGDVLMAEKIISHASKSLVNTVDSAGRNALNYLARNERLSLEERAKTVDWLFAKGFKGLDPSFACSESKTRYELLACSKQTYAELDVELNRVLGMKRLTLNDQTREELTANQKEWLSGLETNTLVDTTTSEEYFEPVVEHRIRALQ